MNPCSWNMASKAEAALSSLCAETRSCLITLKNSLTNSLSLESSGRSLEGAYSGKSLVCFDVVEREVLDTTEQISCEGRKNNIIFLISSPGKNHR